MNELYHLHEMKKVLNDSCHSRQKSEKKTIDYCAIFVIIISLTWSLLIYNKSAVFSEGWYITYANMILSGKTPYVDFELVFFPLYTYIITAIAAIGGSNLITFRIFGVIIFVSIAFVSYKIFNLLFPSWIALIAATIAVFIIQTDNTYVSYDYIQLYDLFNFISLYIILKIVVKATNDSEKTNTVVYYLFGFLCAIAFFFRQTSGLIVFVYYLLFFIVIAYARNNNIQVINKNDLIKIIVGFSIPLVLLIIWLLSVNAFEPFVDMTLLSGTKGSIKDMLFNWIPRTFNVNLLPWLPGFNEWSSTIAVLTFSVLLSIILIKKIDNSKIKNENEPMFSIFFFIAATICVIPLYYSIENSTTLISHCLIFWYSLITIIFIFNVIFGTFLLIHLIKVIIVDKQTSPTTIQYLLLCGFIFAVGYGSATSGGLSFSQSAICFGFICALILNKIEKIPKKIINHAMSVITIIFVIFLISISVSEKVVAPYYWWGITEETYQNQEYTTGIEYFNGMLLTQDEKTMYEDFTDISNNYLSSNDQLYCYSQIPVFYSLAHKIPTVKAPICWFDVARSSTVIEDLNYLKENNPKLIVFADHGEIVMKQHELSFHNGEQSGQRLMYEWLLECKDDANSNYEVIASYVVDNYPIYVMLHK